MNDTYVRQENRSEHLHYKGAWAAGLELKVGDMVGNDGATFVVIAPHTTTAALEPIPEPDEYIVGPTGATGATGPQGIQGPKGDAGIATANQTVESVSGDMNGSNQTFTLTHEPGGQIMLFYNGQFLTEGAAHDYTVSGSTITMLYICPVPGDKLIASYFY